MGTGTRRRLALGAALVAMAGCSWGADGGGSPAEDDRAARIERVVDGDTVVLEGGERVRLIGIDTPETVDPRRPVECFGREASARLAELLPPGTEVEVEYDVDRTDRYGRTLAYLYREDDGLFVNVALAAEGFAEQLTVPPNVRHADAIAGAVAGARDQQLGLWAEGACLSR